MNSKFTFVVIYENKLQTIFLEIGVSSCIVCVTEWLDKFV